MKSLWNERNREGLLARLEKLGPDAKARWGKFTAPKMLAHVNDALRMASGQLPVRFKKTPLRFPIVKQLLVYFVPWPRGAPTAPELLRRGDRAQWDGEREAFPRILAAFAGTRRGSPLPAHPVFGRLSHRAWGRLAWRHVDHHFRQFGG
ncbi:MAG: hypothetical protein ACRD16_04850 [Thermoanaerobaculia bacterium]